MAKKYIELEPLLDKLEAHLAEYEPYISLLAKYGSKKSVKEAKIQRKKLIEMINFIKKQPLADVECVVRCKDCEHYDKCSAYESIVYGENGFCSNGVSRK